CSEGNCGSSRFDAVDVVGGAALAVPAGGGSGVGSLGHVTGEFESEGADHGASVGSDVGGAGLVAGTDEAVGLECFEIVADSAFGFSGLPGHGALGRECPFSIGVGFVGEGE